MSEPFSTSPVQVLHLITRLIVGGAQENTLFTAALLDPSRFKVELLSGPQTGSEGSLIEEVRQHEVPLTILPSLVRQISPLDDLRALFAIWRILHQGCYTIIHTHSSKAGLIGRLAARLARTPIIVHTVHGWSFHEYMPPLTRRVYILLERWMATFSDALIVVSEHDREKGLNAGIGKSERYHTIRSAIPLDEFDPAKYDRQSIRDALGLPANACVIGNVGRFSHQKNPLDWVLTAGMVGRQCPEAWFLLVGDGPLRFQVEAEIEQQGLTDRFILPGLRRDVSRWMAAMDIFLLTSLWEGLPRVLPQAMAMKLPVIANRADGTVEVVQDGQTGYLCTPGDIQKMAQYCIELCTNPLKRSEMGLRANGIAIKEFDLRRMIAQIDDLYYELLLQRELSPGGSGK